MQYLTQKRMHLESRSVTVILPETHECFHGSVLKVLLYDGVDAELNSATGWTPLHEAAWGGHEAIIRILCSKGADVEAKTRFGWNPLQMAAYNGHERAVQALLDGSVDVNTRNSYGWTALHLASNCGYPYVVHLLLENGAEIDAETEYGWTPLFGSLAHWWIMKMLLVRGANPNADNSYGGTILHRAARAGFTRAVRVLLEMGADRNLKTLYGTTALEEARLRGHHAIARLLQSVVEPVGIQQTLTENKARISNLRCSSPDQDLEVIDGVDCQNPQACGESIRNVMLPRERMDDDKGDGTTSTLHPSCGQQISVLFVCLGNFCRSPIAEAVFQSLTKMDQRISRIGSAGVDAEVGSHPDPRTMSILEKKGIVDYHHEARNIQAADFTSFDYILAMDDYILDDLQGISHEYGIDVVAKAKVMLFGHFGGFQGEQVHDVYWGPSEGFEAVYEQIVRLSEGFIAKVLDGNGGGPRVLGTVKAEEQIQE
jgi:ankyrin repeat protein/protein-tyrosine-phosphatase